MNTDRNRQSNGREEQQGPPGLENATRRQFLAHSARLVGGALIGSSLLTQADRAARAEPIPDSVRGTAENTAAVRVWEYDVEADVWREGAAGKGTDSELQDFITWIGRTREGTVAFATSAVEKWNRPARLWVVEANGPRLLPGATFGVRRDTVMHEYFRKTGYPIGTFNGPRVRINDVLFDSVGRIWVATSAGLCVRGEDGWHDLEQIWIKRKPFFQTQWKPQQRPTGPVLSIAEAYDGQIFLVTDGIGFYWGLLTFRADPSAQTGRYEFDVAWASMVSAGLGIITPPLANVRRLAGGKDGTLYQLEQTFRLCCRRKDLRPDRRGWREVAGSLVPRAQRQEATEFEATEIWHFLIDGQGIPWVAGAVGGPMAQKLQAYTRLRLPNQTAELGGRVWSFENGAWRDHPEAQTLIGAGHPTAMAEDSRGKLYVSSTTGILCFDGHHWERWPLTALWPQVAVAQGQDLQPWTDHLYVDEGDRLWIGAHRWLCRFDLNRRI